MKRSSTPLAVQLAVAKRQLAVFLQCRPGELQLDHFPALAQRRMEERFDKRTGLTRHVYVPDAHDPDFLQWMPKREHLEKTTGRRGESRLSQRGGDMAEIAKTKRLEAKYAPYPTLAEMDAEREARRKKFRWPKRPFPKRADRGADET